MHAVQNLNSDRKAQYARAVPVLGAQCIRFLLSSEEYAVVLSVALHRRIAAAGRSKRRVEKVLEAEEASERVKVAFKFDPSRG